MGRPKGAKNKHTFQIEELAQKFDVEPFEILMRLATGDWEFFGFNAATKTVYSPQGIEMEVLNIEIRDRVSAAKDACRYLYAAKQPVNKDGDEAQTIRIIVEDYSKKG